MASRKLFSCQKETIEIITKYFCGLQELTQKWNGWMPLKLAKIMLFLKFLSRSRTLWGNQMGNQWFIWNFLKVFFSVLQLPTFILFITITAVYVTSALKRTNKIGFMKDVLVLEKANRTFWTKQNAPRTKLRENYSHSTRASIFTCV